jgi:hypothetical protein
MSSRGDLKLADSNDIARARHKARCRWEIAAVEAEIRAGHPDVAGLCLALSDWAAELRLLEKEQVTNGAA